MIQVIRMADKLGKTFGTRRAAAVFRAILEEAKLPVVLDFDGVETMTSTFASDVFGELARLWGEEVFRQRISFKNISSQDQETISKVLKGIFGSSP